MLENFFGVATNFIDVVGGVALIIFLGLYFAAEAELYTSGLLRLVPPARRRRGAEILHETASAIWYWMLGRLFSMTVLGVLTAVGLWIIGVPLPVALGFLAGILTFVPYIGAFVSAIPSVLLAASVNLDMALYVIILYVEVHVTEGYILVPLVQRWVVHLPPGIDFIGTDHFRAPRRVSRTPFRNSPRCRRSRHHSDGVCGRRARRSHPHRTCPVRKLASA